MKIIRSLLQERGWPDGCLQRVGIPAAREFCPDYLRIALENMLRNTVEAYGRTGRELPAQPCCELSEPQPEHGAEFRIHIPCLT